MTTRRNGAPHGWRGQPYPCTVTGVLITPTSSRGRPKVHVNDKARKLFARMIEVEKLAGELAVEVGFTPEYEKKFRSWGFNVGNVLNRNKLGARRRNPIEHIHRLLKVDADGYRHPVCGLAASVIYVNTPGGRVATSALAVSEDSSLVTCPDCRRANYVDEIELAAKGR